jgi:hypothetical protein
MVNGQPSRLSHVVSSSLLLAENVQAFEQRERGA